MVETPGFVADRDRVIATIRDSDLMLFTHLEPESPRVLIEALMSACPIVGYDRPHPSDLISVHGGGILSPLGDWEALGGPWPRWRPTGRGSSTDPPRLARRRPFQQRCHEPRPLCLDPARLG